jgi:hypothetical protein
MPLNIHLSPSFSTRRPVADHLAEIGFFRDLNRPKVNPLSVAAGYIAVLAAVMTAAGAIAYHREIQIIVAAVAIPGEPVVTGSIPPRPAAPR